jgi:Flp pilus assembly protein TadG
MVSCKSRRQRRGTTLVLICLLMTLIVGMVAFAVDIGRMYLVRSQLQTAVDSGALAGSRHCDVFFWRR